jgi:predicted amidophosphoribosyltransferase
VTEIRPLFKQCKRCGNWICEPICFNKKAQLCDGCAPDLDKEMAAAQAEAARDQVHEKARSVDWLKDRDVATVSGAACPQCGAATQGGKFCPACGATLSSKKKCGTCGALAEENPKFCPECGQKYT